MREHPDSKAIQTLHKLVVVGREVALVENPRRRGKIVDTNIDENDRVWVQWDELGSTKVAISNLLFYHAS